MTVKTQSKLSVARTIAKRNKNKSRKHILPKLVSQAGLTPKGASRYYQILVAEGLASNVK